MQRITKPTPKRTRPLRNLSTAVRAPASSKPRPEPAIEQGVKLGYQLVEEYLDAGRAAAAALRETPPASSAPLTDSERIAQRLVRYTSEFASVGLELLQSLTKPAAQPPPTGTAGPFAVPQPPVPQPTAAPVAFLCELDAARPAQLALELNAQRPLRALIGHDLRCGEQRLAAHVVFDAALQRITARVHVPDTALPGEYHAALIDPTDNLPRGRLLLRIAAT